MTVRLIDAAARRGEAGRSLLDVVAQVLVMDPAASLAQVAEAAGISRTTLHKNYATRDDLLRAVGYRAISLWEHAVLEADSADGSDGGLRAVTEAMISIGPQLAFLWRTPAFDHDAEVDERWRAVETRGLAVLKRAQAKGVLRADIPDWWLLQTYYGLIYAAAESIRCGRLAPLDAASVLLATFLHGAGPCPSVEARP
jgi:AcrR family transcriptional regulator